MTGADIWPCAFLFVAAMACYLLGYVAQAPRHPSRRWPATCSATSRKRHVIRQVPAERRGFDHQDTGYALIEDAYATPADFKRLVTKHDARVEVDLIGPYFTHPDERGRPRRMRLAPTVGITRARPDAQLPLADALHRHIRGSR